MMPARAILLSLAGLLLAGCGEKRQPLTIGSKDFTEQHLLAEMMALAAENEGYSVRRAIPYGGSRKCLEALQREVIDAYPEYDGTLRALAAGGPALDQPQTALAGILQAEGLRRLDGFGASSGFGIAVRRDVALRFGLSRISDLERLPGELRVAVDEGFLARPVDGLYAMARRYGLEIGSVRRFPEDQRHLIYDALIAREVDAAEVFTTDARLETYGVTLLEDDLGFFRNYEPAPLVRHGFLASRPELEAAWRRLGDGIDLDAMRSLNRRVELGGEDYRDVARSHLVDLGILPQRESPRARRDRVTLAVTPLADQSELPIRAADAIRTVMPARQLRVENHADPADAVRRGKVRFGLVGAESFFELDETGRVAVVPDLEAVGVVGTRLAHLVAPVEAGDPESWTRLGVGVEGGASWQVARLVLAALERDREIELVTVDEPDQFAPALEDGRVDARLIMAPAGHIGILRLLQSGRFRLVEIESLEPGSPALRYPFLRQARIPAATYPGQDRALPSLASQVVLATRLPPRRETLGDAGPGIVPGVITRLPQRLPFATARQLAEALESPEALDPTLPASPGLLPDTPPPRPRLEMSAGAVVLNSLALAFLAAMVLLFFAKLPGNPEMQAGEAAPEEG